MAKLKIAVLLAVAAVVAASPAVRAEIIEQILVKVNGDMRDLPDGETVRALIARYQLTPEKVAILAERACNHQSLWHPDDAPMGFRVN